MRDLDFYTTEDDLVGFYSEHNSLVIDWDKVYASDVIDVDRELHSRDWHYGNPKEMILPRELM